MSLRLKLTVAYLGVGFAGWQRQSEERTVQGELETALGRLTDRSRVAVVGAGRTDAGVHAAAQVAHVDLPEAIPPEVLPRLLNAQLPWDVRVRSVRSMPTSFHARTCARGKLYVYRVRWREPELPWFGMRTTVLPPPEDTEIVAEACRILTGRHDWSSFTVPEVARRGGVRTVHRVEPRWLRSGLDVHFLGEGFLRYQVRRMMGALIHVGRQRLEIEALRRLVECPSPGSSVWTAPAEGLTLERVYYRAPPGTTASDTSTGRAR